MLYKLTEQDMTTRKGHENEFYWEIGKTYTLPEKEDPELCSSDVFHAYTNLNLAFLLNPAHAGIRNPRVFEALGTIVVNDYEKCGVFDLTLTREVRSPQWVGTAQEDRVRVQFAILCAEEVLHHYEAEYPDDNRPRLAIEAAKGYLSAGITAYNATYASSSAHASSRAAHAAAHAAHAAASSSAHAAAAHAHAAAHAAHAAASSSAHAAAASAASAAYAASAAAVIDLGGQANRAVEMVVSGGVRE